MRLWSIHPSILDRQGLGGAWRKGLMAQSVVRKLQAGLKPGYRNHPQLRRFLAQPDPLAALGCWLVGIQQEAAWRGYKYNPGLILRPDCPVKMIVTTGQLEFEFDHLMAKLEERSPKWAALVSFELIDCHPMFEVVEGPVAEWEKI